MHIIVIIPANQKIVKTQRQSECNAHHNAHDVNLLLKILTSYVLPAKVSNYIKFVLIRYFITDY